MIEVITINGIKCCKDCTTRQLHCHETCDVYKDEKERFNARNEMIHQAKEKSNNLTGFTLDSYRKRNRIKRPER